MKKTLFTILLACTILAVVCPAWAQEDERTFERARLLMYDKKWSAALETLQRIGDNFPASRFRADALFYSGKCLEEMKESRRALLVYEAYLKNAPDGTLREEAEVAVIDLAFALYQAGDKTFLGPITGRLAHPMRAVRYYAAFTLSHLADRRLAAVALPVLKEIIEHEHDADLQDRARIAVMRIAPGQLPPKPAVKSSISGNRMLHIRIQEKGAKQDNVSLNIPLAWADLALKALSEKDRRALRQKGYDVENIMSRLTGRNGFAIEINEDGSSIRIWVE